MIVIDAEQAAMADDQFSPSWERCYSASQVYIRLGAIVQEDSSSDTKSVLALLTAEEDVNPYESVRSSGILAFWDSDEEDIYSLDDGGPA